MSEPGLITAHRHSSRHRREPEAGKQSCGCFHCLAVFEPPAIQGWLNEGDGTALCPECGIDPVIGSASGFPVSREFLERTRGYWF